MINLKLLFYCMCLCVEIGSFKLLTIENPDLCSLGTKRKIKLGRGDESTLVIQQTRLNDHLIPWEKNFLCTFKIKTANGDGIFAVIQYLVFRKNETTGECIDYVRFRRKDNSLSQKYCDTFNAALSMGTTFQHHPFDIVSRNAFIDIEGELNVELYVSKEPLNHDEMDLNILFTSFRNCNKATHSDRPCSERYRDYCIYKELFHDGLFNCPFYDCADESGCSEKESVQKESIGNKVLIASVSSLLLIFGIFVCCLWVCRLHKILCWAEDFSNSSTSQNPPVSPSIEMCETNMQPSQPAPTAPTNYEADKDLPPSYDSLFPAR